MLLERITAINYLLDKDYFYSIEDYLQENNIQNINIKKLKFYVKVEENKINRENKVTELTKLFTNNIAVQFSSKNNNDRKAIFHLCSKDNNKYQISFIDSLGAEMDLASNTIENIIDKFMSFYSSYNIIDEVITC